MLILGLLLIAAAVVVGWAIIADATEAQPLDVFGVEFENATGASVFIAGALTMLALLLGLALIQLALSRARKRRARTKELQHDKVRSVSRLEQEKAQLEAELEAERSRRAETHHVERTRTTSTGVPAAGMHTGSDAGHDHSGHDQSGHDHSTQDHSTQDHSGHDRSERGATSADKSGGLRGMFDKHRPGRDEPADTSGRDRRFDVTDTETRNRRP
jgi:hypothetical protein